MKHWTQYGYQAEKHWREFCPRMTAELEAKGQLQAMLLEAEEKTEADLDRIRRQLMQWGQSPLQAHVQAWEMVRQHYILLPPES